MGLADRDYVRRGGGPGGLGAGPGSSLFSGRTVTFWLIVVNGVIFVLGALAANHGTPVWLGDSYVKGLPASPAALNAQAEGPYLIGGQPARPGAERRVGLILERQLVATTAEGQRVLVGLRRYAVMDPLTWLGHFSTAKAFLWLPGDGTLRLGLEVWRLITFQFLHANLMHIVFNMFGLVMFGRIVEGYLGGRVYAAFYLMCGVGGGLLYVLLNLAGTAGLALPGALGVAPTTPLVGASAGVFGVIVASAFLRPRDEVILFFPPIPIKLKFLAYGYVGLAAFNLFISKGQNQGGDAAHIGGAIAGWFFIRRPDLLRDFFDVLGRSDKRRGRQGGRRGGRGPGALRAVARGSAPGTEAEIDRILIKVREHGLGSLTRGEKKTLERSSGVP